MDDDLLRFHIGAYTPDTMPMARLASYLAELAKLLGEQHAVHFVRIEPGSTNVVHKVDREAAPKAEARLKAVRAGHGPEDARRAFFRINSMLEEDGGSGDLTDASGAEIIVFPGATPTTTAYRAVVEHGSIEGKLIRIGGKNERRVPLMLQRGVIDYSGAHASKAEAEDLGKVLFKPVRLYGRGRWLRSSHGEWLLDTFSVESFEVLEDKPLSGALTALRRAARGAWADGAVDAMNGLRTGDTN